MHLLPKPQLGPTYHQSSCYLFCLKHRNKSKAKIKVIKGNDSHFHENLKSRNDSLVPPLTNVNYCKWDRTNTWVWFRYSTKENKN